MAKPSKSKVQSTSLAFFRAWLEGVEEMQGEDWTPTPEQWRRIRDKIMAIEDVPSAPEYPQSRPPVMRTPESFAPQQSFMPAPPMAPPPGLPFGNQPSQKTPDIDSTNGYQSTLI